MKENHKIAKKNKKPKEYLKILFALLSLLAIIIAGCIKQKNTPIEKPYTLYFVSCEGGHIYSIGLVYGAIGLSPHRREVRVWIYSNWSKSIEEKIVSSPLYMTPPIETYLQDNAGNKFRLCGFESINEETDMPFEDWINRYGAR